MGIEAYLKWAVLGPLGAMLLVIGWVWNLVMVDTMIKNGFPITRRLSALGCVPWALSWWFTGIAVALAVRYFRDFYKEDIPAMTCEQIESRLRRALGET